MMPVINLSVAIDRSVFCEPMQPMAMRKTNFSHLQFGHIGPATTTNCFMGTGTDTVVSVACKDGTFIIVHHNLTEGKIKNSFVLQEIFNEISNMMAMEYISWFHTLYFIIK